MDFITFSLLSCTFETRVTKRLLNRWGTSCERTNNHVANLINNPTPNVNTNVHSSCIRLTQKPAIHNMTLQNTSVRSILASILSYRNSGYEYFLEEPSKKKKRKTSTMGNESYAGNVKREKKKLIDSLQVTR